VIIKYRVASSSGRFYSYWSYTIRFVYHSLHVLGVTKSNAIYVTVGFGLCVCYHIHFVLPLRIQTLMPSGPHYDTPTKNRFVGAVENGAKQCEAAKFYGILPSVANRIWKKFRKTGSTHALPQSGRPPIVTDRLEREIVRYSKGHRRAPLQEISSAVSTRVSESTI
jgi:hypothetical protein